MYNSSVSLKETVVELASMVHGTVVSLESVLKVMFVDVPDQVGASRPMYASPINAVSWDYIIKADGTYHCCKRQVLHQPQTHTHKDLSPWYPSCG